MAGADERDDGGGLHEIKMPARAAEQRPRAVAERRRGAERDQRVHVGTADLELVPRAAIKLRAGKNLHRAGERERKPLKPRRHGEAEDPFANHQKHGDGDAEDQIPLPVFVLGIMLGSCAAGVRWDFLRLVTGIFHGLDDGGDVCRRAGIPAHRGIFAFKRDRGAAHAGDGLNRLGDVPRAIAARHALDEQAGGGGIGPDHRFN